VSKPRIWFTADLHLDHKNIIAYCDRPFRDVNHMRRELLNEWQQKVAPEDTVYFLGDLMMSGSAAQCRNLLQHMPGQLRVVLGNHDRALKRVVKEGCLVPYSVGHTRCRYSEVLPEGSLAEMPDGQLLVLGHYPLEEWDGMPVRERLPLESFDSPLKHEPAVWHLHGHSHGRLEHRVPGRLDVGWDAHKRILEWPEVRELVERTLP
jgi:calcineurin-like phosphoesterase family protein